MKFKMFFFVLLVSINVSCQFTSMYKLLSKRLTEKNEKNYNVYKIKGKIFETDEETFFSSEKGKVFENKTNDNVDFQIYKKRYLFAGYYRKSEPGTLLPAILPPLKRLDVIDLEDLSKKWTYDLSKAIPRTYIKSFDPKSGDIIYVFRLRPEKKKKVSNN